MTAGVGSAGRTGRALGFGFCLPTFAAPGPALFRVPAWAEMDAATVLRAAVEADRRRFGSIWVPDHYMIGRDHAVLDGWTTLAAVAGATTRARLCLIQHSMLFRHAPQFAKMAATLDRVSGGRLTVFSSFGRAESEHRAYGFPWYDGVADRIARFEEALEVARRMWTEPGPIDHDGIYFTLEQAIANPKPLQDPLPLWFAGSEPAIYALTAAMGSGWNTHPVSLAEFRHRRGELAEVLHAAGRDIGEITVSMETQVLVRETLDELRAALRHMLTPAAGDAPALPDGAADPFLNGDTDVVPPALADKYLVGTPGMVRDRIAELARAGVDCLGLWFMDFPETGSIDLFCSEIMGKQRENS